MTPYREILLCKLAEHSRKYRPISGCTLSLFLQCSTQLVCCHAIVWLQFQNGTKVISGLVEILHVKIRLKTHAHARADLTAPFPGLPGWAGTRKVKRIWILLKQETVSGSGISWAICKPAPRSRQITTPAPHKIWLKLKTKQCCVQSPCFITHYISNVSRYRCVV